MQFAVVGRRQRNLIHQLDTLFDRCRRRRTEEPDVHERANVIRRRDVAVVRDAFRNVGALEVRRLDDIGEIEHDDFGAGVLQRLNRLVHVLLNLAYGPVAAHELAAAAHVFQHSFAPSQTVASVGWSDAAALTIERL